MPHSLRLETNCQAIYRSICPLLYMFAYKYGHLTISPFVVYAYFHIRGLASLPPSKQGGVRAPATASILPSRKILAKQKSPEDRGSDASDYSDNLCADRHYYRLSTCRQSQYTAKTISQQEPAKEGMDFLQKFLCKIVISGSQSCRILPFSFAGSRAFYILFSDGFPKILREKENPLEYE